MKEYTIRELSEMFDLPASTIRYYEDEGILTNVGRTPSGQRIFTDGHVNRIRTICCLKNTGMTIAELLVAMSVGLLVLQGLALVVVLVLCAPTSDRRRRR